jgi:hypothetical protein
MQREIPFSRTSHKIVTICIARGAESQAEARPQKLAPATEHHFRWSICFVRAILLSHHRDVAGIVRSVVEYVVTERTECRAQWLFVMACTNRVPPGEQGSRRSALLEVGAASTNTKARDVKSAGHWRARTDHAKTDANRQALDQDDTPAGLSTEAGPYIRPYRRISRKAALGSTQQCKMSKRQAHDKFLHAQAE